MHTLPINILGTFVTGDLGDVTMYTNRRGKKVVYPFSPPMQPASDLQLVQRARFAAAHAIWKALSATEKANLETACRRTALVLTGKNLYMSACLTNRNTELQKVGRQAGLDLPTAVGIP